MPHRASCPPLSAAAAIVFLALAPLTPLMAQTPAPAPPETPSAADTQAQLQPAATPTKPAGAAVFPHAVAAKYTSEKPGHARMHTCRDQYRANKAASGNGGLKWIQKGGGYYSQCLKTLKG